MASILKVNTIQDATNSNTALSIDSNGLVAPKTPILQVRAVNTDQSYTSGSVTKVEWQTVEIDTLGAFDSSNNKVLISYRDSGNSNYGTSIVGTVSGTAISFGTEAVFESANSSVIGSAFDSSNNKVVIGYRDAGNSGHGTAVVATISSTSVSFGTPVVFNAAGIQYPDLAFSTQLNKVFIVYQDNETVVNGILGTVSGTSISFGSEISLSGASSGSSDSGERTELGVAFNTTDNNFVIISMPKDGSSATQVFAHTSEEDLSGSLSTDAVTAGTALSATKLLVKG